MLQTNQIGVEAAFPITIVGERGRITVANGGYSVSLTSFDNPTATRTIWNSRFPIEKCDYSHGHLICIGDRYVTVIRGAEEEHPEPLDLPLHWAAAMRSSAFLHLSKCIAVLLKQDQTFQTLDLNTGRVIKKGAVQIKESSPLFPAAHNKRVDGSFLEGLEVACHVDKWVAVLSPITGKVRCRWYNGYEPISRITFNQRLCSVFSAAHPKPKVSVWNLNVKSGTSPVFVMSELGVFI